MFTTSLTILGIYSLISAVSIIIQRGGKFTHKLIPKLPKNKRWSDIFISSGHISVIVFIFYTVNIWFWTDSTEDRSDIWKMSDNIKLLEWKASNVSQFFSTSTNILSFDEAVDSLPEESEEYIKAVEEMRKFNGPELLANFYNLMLSSQCDATLRYNGKKLYDQVTMTKGRQSEIETDMIWPKVREFLKNESTYEKPFTNKRQQIRQHLESVGESLMNIADKFTKKEQELRNKMMETTNGKNKELVFWYVFPSMIVMIFTLLSICTTTFNPQLRSSLLVRIILNVLFYIVAVHVVAVFIYELVHSSDKCQPDPQLLDWSDFEIPAFNKSSRTITKEDFMNCTATKGHIFVAPNDEIFIPTTIYDDYLRTIPGIIKKKVRSPLSSLYTVFMNTEDEGEQYPKYVPLVLKHTTFCGPLREFKEVIEDVALSYPPLVQSLKPFDINNSDISEGTNQLCDFHVDKDFPRMHNAIVASIQKYNNLINATEFDCLPISEAFQHGSKRSCYVINEQLISVTKLVMIGCSVISIITHILTNRKYEIALEKSKIQQQQENQANV